MVNELLDGRRAPQEITPGIRIDPTAEPGLTLFAPINTAFDSVSHLSHVDLLYHILPISLSLKPVNNYTTTFWVRTISTRHSDVQVGVGQVLQVIIIPHKDGELSAYVIFGTPYSPHNIARIISSIPCANGMLHIIDTVMTLPEMTSHVMEQLQDTYQHQTSIERLLKQREKYQEKGKHKEEKEHKDEKEVHHHDHFIRHGINKYHNVMDEYGLMRTVDRFRGITMFIPASTIESNLKHYSSNALGVALLHHIIPGEPIYSFSALLDGAMTRTVILQGISGPVTLTIQRRSGFTPAMDTTDAITVMLNGHVVNPIPSISRNGVVYVVDSCLPDSQDTCTDLDISTLAAPVPVVASDKEALHQMKERLREMRQQVAEREHEMQQRHREIQHDLKERERELIQQYNEKYGKHGQQSEQPQQREQREQPQQPQQGDWQQYVPDYQRFIPGYQQKQQPTSTPPHIIHIGVGHDKTLSIVIGSDGIIVTKEYTTGCEKEDKACHDMYAKEEECECEPQDDKCRDQCDKKEKEREYEKDKEHAHDQDKEHEEHETEKEREHEREKEKEREHEKEHEQEEKEREKEKEREREHEKEKEREHDKEKEREKDKDKEHEHDKEKEREREKEKEHEHEKKEHEHDEKCDKDECDHKEKHTHDKRDDKRDDKHEAHDKHNKHDTKSTSDASVMMIAPELDPSLYDDDESNQQDNTQHDMSTWTMILTVGILGALGLGCATAGYCCLYFQHQPPSTAMGNYATASETTGLLSKSCVPPVRNDMIVTRPCCAEEICDITPTETTPPPLPSKLSKPSQSNGKPTLTLNGYHNSPNGCTHPILGDMSQSESELYMQQAPLHGTHTTVNGTNGNARVHGNSNGNGNGKTASGKRKRSHGNSNGNGSIPRSEAVNIEKKTSPK